MRALRLVSTALRRHRWVVLGLTLCLVLALGGSLAYILPRRAHAATVTVSTCTETALDAAVAAANPGDTIQFACSGTITLTSTLLINKDLTLDGSGQNVILSGGGAVQVLNVLDSNFTLNHITIADGRSSVGSAGLEFFSFSPTPTFTLTLTNCTFTGNTARSTSNALLGVGGGVDAGDAIVNVTNCAFLDNTAQGAPGVQSSISGLGPTPAAGPGNGATTGEGGGVFLLDAIATLTDCTFKGNIAQGGAGVAGGANGDGLGGGLYSEATTLTMTNTTFADNSAQGGTGNTTGGSGGFGTGGGLYIGGGTVSSLGNVSVMGNTAQGGANFGQGGGLYSAGTMTLTNNTVSGNSADIGGGLFNDSAGTLTISSTTFAANSATDGGGGIDSSSKVTINNSIFSGNSAFFGGGIDSSGTLMIGNSTFSDNSAGARGGGIESTGTVTINDSTLSNNHAGAAGGVSSSGTLTMSNSTLSGNHADEVDGGGLLNFGIGTIGSSTFSSNSARRFGGDLFNATAFEPAAAVSISDSIVANSPSGGNCFGPITDGGYNLDSGTSCGFSSANHSLSSTDPKLGPLANNGGPTQTMALLPGSPAINQIPASGANCPATDQRGVSRPQGAACDIGAYEFVPTTATSLSASPNPGLFQQKVQLCATVKPTNNTATPTGSVSFAEGTTTLGTATLNSSGTGCFTTSSLSLGDHSITASYGGDGSFSASTSAPLTVSIQVQGQDVAGAPAGGGFPPSNQPSSQGQTTGSQNPPGTSAGQTQHQHQPAAATPHARPGESNVPWLGTGLGLLLMLLGLGGLGGVFYRASRRRPAARAS